MKIRQYLYGAMGFLSVLGFIGVFTEEKVFLAFFGFIVHFEYFFIKSDEMLEQYMNKSASRAFYCGMLVTAVMSLLNFLIQSQSPNESLLLGLTYGWAISVIIYSLSIAFYGFKENWRLGND